MASVGALMDRLRGLQERLWQETGQTLGEYALILAFIVAICVAAVTLLGVIVLGFYDDFLAGF